MASQNLGEKPLSRSSDFGMNRSCLETGFKPVFTGWVKYLEWAEARESLKQIFPLGRRHHGLVNLGRWVRVSPLVGRGLELATMSSLEIGSYPTYEPEPIILMNLGAFKSYLF